jgi:lauroyl/myristoyl acyltransferase
VSNLVRRVFRWKFLFHELLLPLLRPLGPARSDAVIAALGQLAVLAWPGRRTRLIKAIQRAGRALALDVPVGALWPELAANLARTLARDHVLDVRSDAAALGRFEVHGAEQLRRSLRLGQGAILVGSHMGAYVAGLHWLLRSGLPIRALVQRPRHVSGALARMFDEPRDAHPQSDLFLRRTLDPGAAVEVITRARAAVRDGLGLYICGDIPWPGPNARPGRLLGQVHRFLSVWADLAVITRATVFHVFCTHLPGGEFRLEFECVGRIRAGEENEAVANYLKQLEARIATHPGQAVAHLLWPCFDVSAPRRRAARRRHTMAANRPSRRNAAATS